MKMRTVIEAGRKASPLMNDGLGEAKRLVDSFGQLLVDFSAVKSEEGRAAMLQQCAAGLGRLGESLDGIGKVWRRFDGTLGDYKYQFDRCKKGPPPDCPGQQIMDFAKEQKAS
jgi:hypothetical protein